VVALPQRFKAQNMCTVTVTRAVCTYDNMEASAMHTISGFT